MALWFDLRLNHGGLGRVEIRRREPLDIRVPAAVADTWSTYDVYLDERLLGQVRHRYGDRAWRLLALAAGLISDETDWICSCSYHNRGGICTHCGRLRMSTETKPPGGPA